MPSMAFFELEFIEKIGWKNFTHFQDFLVANIFFYDIIILTCVYVFTYCDKEGV